MARDDLHEMHFKHLSELAELRRELDECRAALDALRGAVVARQRAEDELASLYRQRDIERASATERDPAARLQ